MPVTIHWTPLSSPSRAAMMCAKTLGVDVEAKLVDIMAGESRTPEFIKMNPQHTVPVMEDGDLILHESRAILQYLAAAYGNDSFYPKDIKQRALVDQRLFFDATSLYSSFAVAYYVIFMEKKRPETAKLNKLDESLGFLETFLSQTTFSAGEHFTIAGTISEVAILETFNNLARVKGQRYGTGIFFAVGEQNQVEYNATNLIQTRSGVREKEVIKGFQNGDFREDFTLMATLTTIEACGHDLSNFPKIIAYIEKCKGLVKNYDESNGQGVVEFGKFMDGLLKDIPT